MKKFFLYFILITILCTSTLIVTGAGNNTNEQSTSVVLTYTVTIPYINEPVILEGTVDIMNQAYGLKAKPDTSALHVGKIAELKSFEVGLSNKDGFTITGVVQLLREEATISLQALSKKQMVLTFNFDPVIRIPMSIPNTFPDIVLPELDLTITNEPRQFALATSGASAFNKQVQLALSRTRDAVSGTIKVPGNVTITNFMPEAIARPIKGTAPDKVALQDLTVQINNFLKKKTGEEKFSATITGKMDFSQLALPGTLQDIVKKPLDLKGTIDQTDGAVFTAFLPTTATLPGIAQISNPHLYVNYNPYKKVNEKAAVTVGLGGTATINLPAGLGSFAMDLEADYKDNDFIIAGTLQQKLDLKLLTIDKAQVTISKAGDYHISGESTVRNLDVIADVEIKKDGTKTVSAKIAAKEFKPFSATNIPYVQDIAIQDATLRWASGAGADDFTIEGDSTILNTPVKLSISFVEQNGTSGLIGKAQILKKDWKIPAIPGLVLTNPLFVISTIDNYQDKTDPLLKDIRLVKGLGLYTELPLGEGALEPIGKITKKETEKIKNVYGTIGEKSVSLSVAFPVPNFPGLEKFITNLTLYLQISSEAKAPICLKGTFDLQKIKLLTSSELPMTADGCVGPEGIDLGIAMHGEIKDPFFFLKGITIRDLAGEIELVLAPEPVKGFGFQGAIESETFKKTGTMALKVSIGNELPLLYFAFNEFGLHDFINLLNVMGAKIPAGSVPNFGLKDVYFYFAPTGGKIVDTTYPKGTSMKGSLELFGPTATMEAQFPLNLKPSDGVSFTGTLDKPITFGPLSFTAATDTAKGPSTTVKLTPQKQEVSLDGKMKFFIIEGEAQGTFGLTGGSFTTSGKFGIGDVTLSATIKDLTSKTPDVEIKGTIDIETSKILKEIEDKINQYLLGPVLSGVKEVAKIAAKILDKFIPTQALGQAQNNIVSAALDFADATTAINRGDLGGASKSLGKVIVKVGEATGKAVVGAIKGIFTKKHHEAARKPQPITKDVSDLYTALTTLGSIFQQNKNIVNTHIISDDPKLTRGVLPGKLTAGILFGSMRWYYMSLVHHGQLQGTSVLVFQVDSHDQFKNVVSVLNNTYDFFNKGLNAIQNTFYRHTEQNYQNLANIVAGLKQLNAPAINLPPLPPKTTQQEGLFESFADKIPDHIPLPPMGLDMKLTFDGSPTKIDVKLAFSLHPFVSNVTLDINIPLETILKEPESFISTLAEKIFDAAKDDIKKALHL